MSDRRKVHHGNHGHERLGMALAASESRRLHAHRGRGDPGDAAAAADTRRGHYAPPDRSADILPIEMEGDGPVVLREKAHKADPMTLDQALFEMELVGHDFYPLP